MIFRFADVELATKNGFDAFLFGDIEEVHRAVDVAVVGHGDGALAERGHAVHELGKVASAIEEGVLGVQMEVGELGHG